MLTVEPTEANQLTALCPAQNRTIHIPRGTPDRSWQYCQACESVHRVIYIDRAQTKPALRSV